MIFRSKFIAIPEFNFTEYGEIIDISSIDELVEMNRHNLTIVFTSNTLDNYNKLTENLINNNRHIGELLMFINNNESIVVHRNCTVTNIDISINNSDHRLMTSTQSIFRYKMELTLECSKLYVMDTTVFDRQKKLDKIINTIK